MTNAITEARSLDRVVEIINAAKKGEPSEYFGGTDLRTAEQMAGQYAWEAAKESGCTDDDSIEAHLDILLDAGCNFYITDALRESVNLKKQ